MLVVVGVIRPARTMDPGFSRAPFHAAEGHVRQTWQGAFTHRWPECDAPPTLIAEASPSLHSCSPVPFQPGRQGLRTKRVVLQADYGLEPASRCHRHTNGQLHRQIYRPRRNTRQLVLRWLLRRIFHWNKDCGPCQGIDRFASPSSVRAGVRRRSRSADRGGSKASRVSLRRGTMPGRGALGSGDRSSGGRGAIRFPIQPEAQCAGQNAPYR